jgi:tripartite-type tricarboxylate transporter receptor subunit TctC
MANIVLTRRQLLPLAAGFVSLGAAPYPNQTINFIIPYSPGGSFDSYGRQFSALLQQRLPAHVNVEPLNVPGAGGRAAIVQLLEDPADGYNISMISIPGILMSKNRNTLNLDKLTWIANLGRDSYGLAVGVHAPIKTIADLRAVGAKRTLKFASSGTGSTDYFASKVFAAALGLRIALVPGYNDSPDSVVAVARGDVDCVVHSLATLQQLQHEGLARILFVFQKTSPIPGIEDATSVGQPDLGKIFQWRPVGGPPNLPPEIVSTLSTALVTAAQSSTARQWASALGTTLCPLDWSQTRDMIQAQEKLVARWHAVLS